MDDDEYLDSLMLKVSTEITYTWFDCVDGFKQADVDMGSAFHRKLDWMNRAADIYLSDNNKMAGFIPKFADACGVSYQYGKRLNRLRKKVPCTVQKFSHDAWEAILSAPEELREEIVSSDKPMTAPEVNETKANYNDAQTKPEFSNVKTDLDNGTITPFEASEIVKEQKEKTEAAREKIQNSVPPNVIDLNAIAKDTNNTDLQNVGPAFIALMEKLCSKFDDNDIKKELSAFMNPDPIGLKVDALHKMTNILTDLCVDFPVKKLKNLN